MAADTGLDRGEGVRELNPPCLSLRLRAATAEAHRAAEGSDFQRDLLAGAAGRAAFRDWVGQLLHLHLALEERLWREHTDPAWRELCAGDRRRSRQLEADLLDLGSGPVPPCEPILDLAAQVAADADPPAFALGVLYVLEGSSNGGRMIARPLRQGLGLEGEAGTRHLDPYGPAQGERWRAFRQALDEALPESRWARAVDGAQAAFQALGSAGAHVKSRHDEN
jgi:heme oxygenase